MDYKKTLNLPKTDFPMKANLVKNEPEIIKKWDRENLYEISLTLENIGALPTYIMKQALDIGCTKPGVVKIELLEGMKLFKGKKLQTFVLDGFLNKVLSGSRYERENLKDKNKMMTFIIL